MIAYVLREKVLFALHFIPDIEVIGIWLQPHMRRLYLNR
jgi:hypothetical protein